MTSAAFFKIISMQNGGKYSHWRLPVPCDPRGRKSEHAVMHASDQCYVTQLRTELAAGMKLLTHLFFGLTG